MLSATEVATLRKSMIKNLLTGRFLRKQNIIDAFDRVPRHFFVLDRDKDFAYSDIPLPIGLNATISAPHIVATMLEWLDPQPEEKVLEIGSGSGWTAALISEIVGPKGSVVTIESDPGLVDFAKSNVQKASARNVKVVQGDGSKGYPKEAPYDKILVTCAIPKIFMELLYQLKPNGVIVAPVGAGGTQDLTVAKKVGREGLEEKKVMQCVFVPIKL